MRRSLAFFRWEYYINPLKSLSIKTKYAEDGTPTMTTSLKNVGLNGPKRSGVEDIPVGCVNLSLQRQPIVSTADSTVSKEYAMRRKLLSCSQGCYSLIQWVPQLSRLDGFADALLKGCRNDC